MPGCTKRYTDPSSLRKHVKNHSARDVHLQLTGHAVRRKSQRDNSRGQLSLLGLPDLADSCGKTRRYSDSSATASLYAPLSAGYSATPGTAFTTTVAVHAHTHFSFEDCFGELTGGGDTSSDSNAYPTVDDAAVQQTPAPATPQTSHNSCHHSTAAITDDDIFGTMNFHAMSDCIVTIQNNHAEPPKQQQATAAAPPPTASPLDGCGVGVDEYVSFECVKKLLLDEPSMDYNIDQSLQATQFEIDYFNGIM